MPATRPASRRRLGAQQASHELLREVLGRVVLAAIEPGTGHSCIAPSQSPATPPARYRPLLLNGDA